MAARPAARPPASCINLAESVELLHTHLTAALCDTVFQRVRNRERQRRWTVAALAQFWLTVILTAPRSLTQALQEGGMMFPALGSAARTSPEAFFQRAERLRPHFFQALYEAFIAELVTDARSLYAASVSGLRERFSEVWILDGTRLDRVAHRLKLTWDVRSPLLPGCLLVLYDVFRGFPRQIAFCADAARHEMRRAHELVGRIPPGTLLVADRLYASMPFVAALGQHQLWLVCRLNRLLKVTPEKVLGRVQRGGGTLTERLVMVGSGQSAPPQRMRHIRWRARREALDLLTTVLEPTRLSAEEALTCYRLRWQVERLFFDLKEVLDLHHFYLASPRGVAQQVYAAGLVYAAMRTAQARIAQRHGLTPEQLSPAKLFPRVARVSIVIVDAELAFAATQRANPDIVLAKPDWAELPSTQVSLAALLIERRRGTRRKRRFCASRHRRKSFAHLPGARRFDLS
jgi:hypothetical protein